jgi:uncharacterized Zn finger protein
MRIPDLPYVSRIVGARIRDTIKEYWNDACPRCGSREEKKTKMMFQAKMHYVYYCGKCATDKRIEKYTMDEVYDRQLKEL